jgi:hypothetical protein
MATVKNTRENTVVCWHKQQYARVSFRREQYAALRIRKHLICKTQIFFLEHNPKNPGFILVQLVHGKYPCARLYSC